MSYTFLKIFIYFQDGCLLGNLFFKNSAFKTNPYELIGIEFMRLPKTYLNIFEETSSSDGNPYIRKNFKNLNNQNCTQFFNLLNISDTFATNPFINKGLGPPNLAITYKLDEKCLVKPCIFYKYSLLNFVLFF